MRSAVFGLVMSLGAVTANAQANEMAKSHVHTPSVASTSLTVIANGKTITFSVADLQVLPQQKITVHNGHSKVDEQYTGVAVSDLLERFGVTLLNGGDKKVYHSYLRATGTDGYYILYSTSEVENGIHAGDVIVATTQDGKPLGTDGQFKLVSSEDKKPARWVRNLKGLVLVDVN